MIDRETTKFWRTIKMKPRNYKIGQQNESKPDKYHPLPTDNGLNQVSVGAKNITSSACQNLWDLK